VGGEWLQAGDELAAVPRQGSERIMLMASESISVFLEIIDTKRSDHQPMQRKPVT
jgi:hypothetical protein